MNYLNKLMDISSEPISKLTSNNLPAELQKLYQIKNGFVAFESSLRIYDINHIQSINNAIISKLNGRILFFGDSALGDGFCIKDNNFYKYDFELGEFDFMGENIEDFSKKLLLEYDYYTGYKLVKNWMSINGLLPLEKILMPKIPFSLGGEYALDNLIDYPRIKGIQKKIELYKKLKGIDDGEKVVLQEIYRL